MTLGTEFHKRFLSYVTEERFGQAYRNNTVFTEAIVPEIANIIREMGFTPQFEYYRVDVIGWNSRWQEVEALARAWGMNPHLWDLMIAVEHENDPADWADELIKLAHLRCPLKVIIGYNHCDCREEEPGKLRMAAEWLSRLNAFSGDDQEEFLIIMGNCAPKHDKRMQYDRFDYRGYLLDPTERKFRPI